MKNIYSILKFTCLIKFQLFFGHIPDFPPTEVISHASTGNWAADGTGAGLASNAELLTKGVGVVPVGTATLLSTAHLRTLFPGPELDNLSVRVLLQILTLDQGHGATLVAVSSWHTVVIQTTPVVALAIHTSSKPVRKKEKKLIQKYILWMKQKDTNFISRNKFFSLMNQIFMIFSWPIESFDIVSLFVVLQDPVVLPYPVISLDIEALPVISFNVVS